MESKQAKWIVQVTKIGSATKQPKPKKHIFESKKEAEKFSRAYNKKGSVQIYRQEFLT